MAFLLILSQSLRDIRKLRRKYTLRKSATVILVLVVALKISQS